ncbi:peroxiredoxin [Candidatus Woesearchaeota archaeon]|nr:peroxiredoxin [Candidatus Woesearchaeota archaeon]
MDGCGCESSNGPVNWQQSAVINWPAPEFTADAFQNGKVQKISLSDFRGKWVVLYFYPADFTFICPTELGDLADKYEEIKKLGAEVISVSTDTTFVHKAWHDNSATIRKIKFPMLADPTGSVCRSYGTYISEEGLSLRGTFIIDPDGILKALELHDNSIGRSGDELLRKIKAADFVRKHGGEVCPVNWQPGNATLKPGLDLVGKI